MERRERTRRLIETAIVDDPLIVGAFLVGSVATGTADAYSDLDYYLYVETSSSSPTYQVSWWTKEGLANWLGSAGMSVDLHFWSGVDKHHLLIDSIRVDFSFNADHQRNDIARWPHLFFPLSAIVKDNNGVLEAAYRCNAQSTIHHALNDYAAYVLDLFTIAIQLCRGETVNARCRFVNVVESQIRALERLDMGTALWREPSRHLEERWPRSEVEEVTRLAYIGSARELCVWLIARLQRVESDASLNRTVRDRATFYASELLRTVLLGQGAASTKTGQSYGV